MSATRWYWALLLAVFALSAPRVMMIWPDVPATMASHFDASGRADGWMPKERFFFMTAVTEVGLCALLATTAVWARWLPVSLINLPNRDYWLHPDRKEQSVRRLGRMMTAFAVATALFFVGLVELTIQANLGGTSLSARPFAALIFCLLAATVALIVVVYKAFGRQSASSSR